MNKNGIVVIVALVVVGTIVFMASGMMGGDEASKGDDSRKASGASAGGESAAAAAKKAPKVTKDNEKAEVPTEEKARLDLPKNLPRLGVRGQPAPKQDNEQAAKPHGELELSGSLKAIDAEVAIKAIWPKARACYVELRQRAPQAKGRILMRFRVQKGDDGKGSVGELLTKETQFTDPKFLSCFRDAVENTKVALNEPTVDGTVTFNLHFTPEDVDRHNAGAPAKK